MIEPASPDMATANAGQPEASMAAPPSAPSWHRLDVKMQTQAQTFWCWAAVAVSVARFFYGSAPSQCELATEEQGLGKDPQGKPLCCGSAGSGSACNVYWFLSSALARLRCFRDWAYEPAPDAGALQTEIDAKQPVGVRTQREDGSAHFTAVIGYLPDSAGLADSTLVAVADPGGGGDIVSFAQLRSGYLGGIWSDTIYTERSPS